VTHTLPKVVLPVAAVGLLVFAIGFVIRSRDRPTPSAPLVAPNTAEYEHAVAAAGLVEAQTENISVGSPLPGIVLEVRVRVGEDRRVKPGELLFRLDDRQLKAEREMRRAALESARAELARLENLPRPEEVPVRQAQVDQAAATLREKEDVVRRLKPLYESRTVTEEEYMAGVFARDTAKAAHERAAADLALLKAGASLWEKDVARAAVALAQAQLNQTEMEIKRLEVVAPNAGDEYDFKVLQVNVRPGEFVGAPPGTPLIVLGSTRRLHVRADIDENDIPRFVKGNAAVAKARGVPERKYALRFVRVEPFVVPKRSLTGQNTERVDTRVLQVIYAFEDEQAPFYVGQQVDVSIDASKVSEEKPSDEEPLGEP
jgi:multidrug resistance efflux pump